MVDIIQMDTTPVLLIIYNLYPQNLGPTEFLDLQDALSWKFVALPAAIMLQGPDLVNGSNAELFISSENAAKNGLKAIQGKQGVQDWL